MFLFVVKVKLGQCKLSSVFSLQALKKSAKAVWKCLKKPEKMKTCSL